MSINSAMSAGVSGMVANSAALAAISDNIANVNTIAYKRNQVNFASVVTAQSVPGRYSAGGVTAVTRQLIGQQGLVQTASSPTDIAINGDGFFVVTQKGQGLTSTDPRLFTRSGSFTVDANGYLVNDSGMYLQGWLADANGNFAPDPSDVTVMQPINVKAFGTAVAPTSSIGLNGTLDKRTPVSPGYATYDPATMSMADYAANGSAATGTQPDFTMQMSVVDSAGGTHKVAIGFLKTSTPNQWAAEIYAVPASDVTAAAGKPAGQIASGIVEFNNDGTINLDPTGNTTLFGAAGAPTDLALDASSGSTPPQWDPSLGIAAQTIHLDLSKINQIAAASALNSVTSDGATAGNVISVQVGTDGVVSAIFDNSQIRSLAKIGLVTFPNPDGLKAVNGNAFQASRAAGTPVVKAPGVGGAGQIAPSSLEASTVDLAAEFTGLITTQKAYSASSKIITTADQMLDELIQMMR
jgi:flagellar hook protein FlgE